MAEAALAQAKASSNCSDEDKQIRGGSHLLCSYARDHSHNDYINHRASFASHPRADAASGALSKRASIFGPRSIVVVVVAAGAVVVVICARARANEPTNEMQLGLWILDGLK